jgi:flagellar biosynthesis protein FlhG
MNDRLIIKRQAETATNKPHLYAIASGKGGIGKSVISFNLAQGLSTTDRVLLIDGDFQMGNLHLLGNITPTHNWYDVCLGRVDLSDAVCPLTDGLDVLSSVGGSAEEALPQMRSLADNLANLRDLSGAYDYVIIDTASGVLPHTTLILNTVDEVILVTTPELTSISDCYALYKILVTNNRHICASLLINGENRKEDREYIYHKFAAMSDRFLGRIPGFLGWLGNDPAIVDSVAHQKGIFDHAPNSMIAKQFVALVRKLKGGPEHSRFEQEIINSNPLGADIKGRQTND